MIISSMRLACQVLVLLTLIKISICAIADLSQFRQTIIDRHNEYRRSQRASNMREMEWDSSLARRAERYASQCRYQRPQRNNERGENLFFETGYAKHRHAKEKLVGKALDSWDKEKDYFAYGTDCGSACSFVQMIMADTYRVGCGLAHCRTVEYGRQYVRHASLFVCYYSPRGRLIGNYPYERGRVCSNCPRNTRCRKSLCSSLNRVNIPSNIVDPPRDSSSVVGPILPNSGPLTATDKQYVLLVHNRMRENQRLPQLEWNSVLELWASYVIRCDIEYPGPRNTFTNFGKIDRSQAVQQLIYEWADEGDNVFIHMSSGCRTPSDNKRCNHNTNIMEPLIRRVGCAAMACDRKRQLTCIYDDRRR